MKKKLLLASSIATLIILGLVFQTNSKSLNEIDTLREKHISFLDNSPFKETQKLTKSERKANGLPPNSYNEMMWDLTMDPATGKPEKERLFALQETLSEQFNRVPGENTNSWEERGPDNVGGRTRAIMYDPNDGANGYKRVFAGGVSGGLWVIDDITNAASTWTEVGIPQNLAITCITYDPNDTDIFYVGTGESYVGGDVNGNGVWKSTDGGASWFHVFGGTTGATVFQADAVVTVNSPGSIAGDVPAILATAFGGQLGSPVTGNLVLVEDGTGADVNDACEALTNGAAINGNIAVIRRGSCNFDDKINKAQAAGAIAVIMVNNIAGLPISMGGDDATITIPSVMISRDEGNAIIAELGGGVNATMELSGATFSGTNVPGVHHINDIRVRDNGGVSEVYMAASSTVYADGNPRNWFGIEDFGLYKSIDAASAVWTKMNIGTTSGGTGYEPNDIEIAIDNSIYIGTETNPFGQGGGAVLKSTDGTTFTTGYTRISGGVEVGGRTQIAVSGTDAGKVYILMTQNTGNALWLGLESGGFGGRSPATKNQPQDVDTSARLVDDFTGGQGFYDLLLEVDPTDDTVVYVGGIDLFRSSDAGLNWDQISKWSNNNALAGLGVSLVHSDQHILTFNPSNANLGVFGNDGGVYYSNTLSGSSSNTSAISARNNNYNTLQFYKGAIGQEVASEKLLAGAQDNANQLINNASPGIGSSSDIANGGDGAYVFIDRDNEFMISSFVFNVYRYHNYTSGGQIYTIANNQADGAFINPAALDSDNNKLYAEGTTGGTTYQIYRYNISPGSATRTVLTNALLTRSATAFKPSTFTTTTLFVGQNDGTLLKLLNANAAPTWSTITGPDFVGSISCIELGATENDIFVTFYNYGVKSIFYSDDGGTTWSNKEGNLPDIPVRAILQNPLNAEEVIVGTDLGVWATKDFSSTNPTWYQSQDGMKDVVVTSFDLRTADNTVLASTYGRGMFTGTFDATASGLSVDDFTQNNLIKIYPTVSNGEITIAPTSEVRAGALNIFDINGREVHASNLDFATGANQRLTLNLSSGVYIVKFTANDVQSSQKIIIE